MKVVVAMDSFKGSLSAQEACHAVADGLRRVIPGAHIALCPMADGGEGTVDTVLAATGGVRVERQVMGPLPDRQVIAHFALLPDSRALVEMAQASGLERLTADELDPLATTTYGTGQLLAAARESGPSGIWLAVGGSATIDGGVGAAMAVGWRFLDSRGRDIGLGGGELGRIRTIEPPHDLTWPALEVLCDVDNPLCGPHGAAPVFGPQKGADPEMVKQLEDGLQNLAAAVERSLGVALQDLPGAGAAGGLAGGAVAFFGGKPVAGIDIVMRVVGLERQLTAADWVLTGEGRFDAQSLGGKVFSGVRRLAMQAGCRLGVVAGTIELDDRSLSAADIAAAEPVKRPDIPLERSLAAAAELLTAASERLVRRALT